MEKVKSPETQINSFTYGSVCSGIEAATVAWHSLGCKPSWFAEIEKFPNEVLAHHYPNIPNLGDMTQIADKIKNDEVCAPDVLVGGTPCQAFSVAGLRESLNDERGQLSLEFVRIADEIDAKRKNNNQEPCVILWENVPGVLNTKDNAFGCFLGALSGEGCELQPPGGRWKNAGCVFGPSRQVTWRVLDAKFFGLAQRRRRVFVVASARKECIAEILFERKSLYGNTEKSRGTRESLAECGETNINESIETVNGKQIFPTLLASSSAKGWGGNQEAFTGDYYIKQTVGISPRSLGLSTTLEQIGTLTAGDSKQPLVVVPTLVIGGLHPNASISSELSPALTSAMGKGGGHIPLVTFGMQGNVIGRSAQSGCNGVGFSNEQSPTLTAGDKHGVAYAIISDVTPKISKEINGTLRSTGGGGIVPSSVVHYSIARYLTEVECERLQGFPDNYTNIPKSSKGKRYKAIGNSMAVPVMQWIGERINIFMNSDNSKLN